MALLGEDQEAKSMPTSPKSSNPLPNFSLPTLKWASQRRTRCSSAFASGSSEKRRVVDGNEEDRIALMREKLILDLKTEVDRMNNAILRDEEKKDEEKTTTLWNLRKRHCSFVARPNGAVKLPQMSNCSEKTGRVKFSVQLSKTEIEDDFMKMLGQKPPRKPKKWPRAVQNQLDTLFPVSSFADITADSYKVLEAADKGKMRRSGKKA